MPTYNYERNAAQEGIGTGIGLGNSVINIMKQLASERQNNRLLEQQFKTHYEDLARQDAERERSFGLQDRQLKILEKMSKTVSPGEGLFEIDPTTGKYKQVASMPNRPLANAKDQTLENAKVIYETLSRKIPSEMTEQDKSDLSTARQTLGLPPTPEPQYKIVNEKYPGAIPQPNSGLFGSNFMPKYVAPITPTMQNVLNAGKPQGTVAPTQAPAQTKKQLQGLKIK